MSEDEIQERMSRRFGEQDDTDDASQNEMSASDSSSDENAQASQKNGKAQNVKKEWNVRSFYLNDDLDSDLTTTFKRLDLELSEAESGVDLKKTRHFYPLLVELGLERLEEMEVTEVTERLESPDSV